MKLLNVLLIVSLCAVALPSLADERPRDGTWWQNLPASSKHVYILGYFDAASGASGICTSLADMADRFTGVSNAEITAGLDQFYAADFRNLHIDVSNAALLTLLAATGEPSDKLRARLDLLRSRGTR